MLWSTAFTKLTFWSGQRTDKSAADKKSAVQLETICAGLIGTFVDVMRIDYVMESFILSRDIRG
jgi:hypothetical protein